MAIEYISRQLNELYEEIENKSIVLPNFQRGFVWSVEEQKKLLASMIVQIPIGSTLHLKGKNNAFSARALCENSSVIPSTVDCEYVLDGQQRLSTLKNAFYDVYSNAKWGDVWKNLFSKLRYRWYFSIETENDIFGIENLDFDVDKLLQMEPRLILDTITYKKILKKDSDKWFHPGYLPRDKDENIIIGSNEKKLHIAEKAFNENLIPLYEVYLGNDGIHTKVIEILGQKQINLIKAIVHDTRETNKLEYEKLLIKILTSIETNIAEIMHELNNESIDKLIEELGKKWVQKVNAFMERLVEIDLPIIRLEQNEAGRAAAIFEEMNSSGTALSIYDLIVAKVATADSSQTTLTKRIIELLEENHTNIFNTTWCSACMTNVKENMLTSSFQATYLNALSILIAKKNGKKIEKTTISRNNVLALSGTEINSSNKHVIVTIIRAYAFLQFRCGVINEKNIIYDYMLLPLIYFLENDTIWNDQKKLNILEGWYWSWLFGGKYKERQDEQFVRDIDYLTKILVDNQDVNIGEFLTDRLMGTPDYSDQMTLMHQNEATDKTTPKSMKDAILQYVLSRQPQDFLPDEISVISADKAACNDTKIPGKNCKQYKLEIHHIIPLGTVTAIGESTDKIRKDKEHILNSPLNLAYISECANAAISDMDYSLYKKELGHKVTTHLLTLEEYRSLADMEKSLSNRFIQIKSSLNSHIAKLIQ